MAAFMKDVEEKEAFQAMEALVYNLNSMHSRAGAQVPFSSLNLGLDTSEEGRKVTRNLLLAFERGLGKGENPIFPNIIFRVKKGINFEQGDPNYDLFKLAIKVASQRLNPTFSFMDTNFNKEYNGDMAYMGCRTRVVSNRHGEAATTGRGNLSFTTINLPRLGIKAKNNTMLFYQYLDELLELTCEQLYHRFSVQSNLRIADLPFFMGQGLYMDYEKLGSDDNIKEVLEEFFLLRVANIINESVVDGVGIRLVVFFQGCTHLCKGCHNPKLLPFEGGTDYTVEQLAEIILENLTFLHKGITFSGGDPLFQADELSELIKYLRKEKPDLNIWTYTGYKYEDIINWEVLKGIDILVDGRFEEGEKDFTLRFKGSRNQRIIDVKKSLEASKVIEYQLPD